MKVGPTRRDRVHADANPDQVDDRRRDGTVPTSVDDEPDRPADVEELIAQRAGGHSLGGNEGIGDEHCYGASPPDQFN